MRRLDPRLLRYASGARGPVGGLAGTGVLGAGLTIAQAWLLATVIAQAFIDKATLPVAALGWLAAITAGRAVTAWAAQACAHRAAVTAKARLRGALLSRVIALGPSWRRSGGTAEGGDRGDDGDGARAGGPPGTAALTQLATAGLDGLDGYFTGYLPALMLAAAVPLAVLAAITAADPRSGIVVPLTVPLVPLFGALIGMATGDQARQRMNALGRLAHHFHDVVSGLPTLRVFGRAVAQRERIGQVTGDYRRATMATLRLAFLSSFALELIATMSVALVATEIGLRLAYGHLDLRAGLFALILAPEAYLPLHNLGTQFHAVADGLAAAGEVFAILEAPDPAGPVRPGIAGQAAAGPDLISVEDVSVRRDGRAEPAPAHATFTIAPGRLTVLTGPSGCGKTTLVSCLLGFTRPGSGTISFPPGWRPWSAAGEPRSTAASPRRSSCPRSPRPPSRSPCPATRSGTWSRCAASWPPPPWNCLTGRRSSPCSAPASARSPPSRARRRESARQASVPGMRGERGRRWARSRRVRRCGARCSSRCPQCAAGHWRACCSPWCCSPRSRRTRCSPGSPRPRSRFPGCARRRPGSRRSWAGPPRWPSRRGRPHCQGRRTTWRSAA